eukprot:2367735-Rhodomonas_salina.1
MSTDSPFTTATSNLVRQHKPKCTVQIAYELVHTPAAREGEGGRGRAVTIGCSAPDEPRRGRPGPGNWEVPVEPLTRHSQAVVVPSPNENNYT